jgi:hypothetical protein
MFKNDTMQQECNNSIVYILTVVLTTDKQY